MPSKRSTSKTAGKGTSRRSSSNTSSQLPYSGPEKPDFDDKGRIKKWSSNCQDGLDLKIYIEYGCCENMAPNLIKEKFPQFKKYAPGTFNSAVQNCKRSINAQVNNRKQVNCEFFFSC